MIGYRYHSLHIGGYIRPSAARRPPALRMRSQCTNRLDPGNNRGIRNLPLSVYGAVVHLIWQPRDLGSLQLDIIKHLDYYMHTITKVICCPPEKILTLLSKQRRTQDFPLEPTVDGQNQVLKSCENIPETFMPRPHQLPTYPGDLHCVLRRLATSSCRGSHVDESATGLSLSPHREHGTRCRHS